jgi:parvulin-like peptidyl-prolyl isomerase
MKTVLLLLCISLSIPAIGQRTEVEAKQLADSLYLLLKKKPQRFCELIELFSEDAGSTESCGLYGFEKGTHFVTPIADAVSKRKKSTKLLPPLRTSYGYHIIQPLGVRDDEIQFKHLFIAVKSD